MRDRVEVALTNVNGSYIHLRTLPLVPIPNSEGASESQSPPNWGDLGDVFSCHQHVSNILSSLLYFKAYSASIALVLEGIAIHVY